MTSDPLVTVWHGTNYPYDQLREGCWVTSAREEAVGYARASAVSAIVDNPKMKQSDANRPLLLKARVLLSQIEFINGQGDCEFDGQHGKLRTSTIVIETIPVSEND